MRVIEAAREAASVLTVNPNRPATAIVHDSEEIRLVVFRLQPGQEVPPHRSTSSVMLTVLAGRGVVSGEDGEQPVSPGDVICYVPNELHGMKAEREELRLLATIAPRPGARPAAIAAGRDMRSEEVR
jgi:quercetin dioxygenase-like cupin family protein